jgi:hypothetical protein
MTLRSRPVDSRAQGIAPKTRTLERGRIAVLSVDRAIDCGVAKRPLVTDPGFASNKKHLSSGYIKHQITCPGYNCAENTPGT